MTTTDTKERIRAFILRSVRSRDFGDDDDLFALGFVNSMFAIQLVMFVEQEFGVKVEDEDLDITNFVSVNAIGDFVGRKTGGRG